MIELHIALVILFQIITKFDSWFGKVGEGYSITVRLILRLLIKALLVCEMQKLKTRVIKKDVNPEWNEDLTLSVTDPSIPIQLVSGDMFQLCICMPIEECNPSFNLGGGEFVC